MDPPFNNAQLWSTPVVNTTDLDHSTIPIPVVGLPTASMVVQVTTSADGSAPNKKRCRR